MNVIPMRCSIETIFRRAPLRRRRVARTAATEHRPPKVAVGWLGAIWIMVCAISFGATEPKREFRAGAARVDITPDLGILIVGSFNPTPATHVHDPLYARTLVLDDGATKIAFVVVDNVGVPKIVCDEAKRMIAEATGLPKSHVLISSTHSHSAGSARERSDTKAEEIRDGFTGNLPKLA